MSKPPAPPPALELSRTRFDAVIFDLDGVVTQTAAVHAATWKRLFDAYLRERSARDGSPFQAFDAADDYLRYVDGKPRYDGVQSFLESRGIQLSRGSPDDADDAETVCGLGNRKNGLFKAELQAHGVRPYTSTLDLIRALRDHGFKTAIISSSKNCLPVLEAAHARDLFDEAVEGVESARIGIPGKPAPDIFLEAARRLGVPPSRAVAVEDAISGVQSASAGGFACVIGVNRGGDPARLARNGATVVVADLAEVVVVSDEAKAAPPHPPGPADARSLPSALEGLDALLASGATPAVFLDYDGTLTPIVPRPEDAILAPAVRSTVARLAQRCTVAIISGRDRADVQKLVGVDGIVYAGSHGFDIATADGVVTASHERDQFLPMLADAGGELARALAAIEGSLLERKKYSIAVHYRNVADADLPAVEAAVTSALQRYPKLRDLPGKKVHDLQPRIDWDKGKALFHVLRALGLDRADVLPVYIGDDVTDEDAFQALRASGRGLGIVVRDEPRPTAAGQALDSPADVHAWLAALLDRLSTSPAGAQS